MIGKRLSAILLTLCFIVTICVPAVSAEEEPKVESYLVLGDSLAIGFEPGMDESSVPYGYSDRLFEQALFRGRATLVNYGIGGLNTAGFDNLMQAVADEAVVKGDDIQADLPDPRVDNLLSDTKKIKADIATASLITVTIGGNDVKNDVLANIASLEGEAFETFVDEWMASYKEKLSSALSRIFEINPDVRVFVADQYSPYPPLNKTVYEKTQSMKDRFTETLLEVEQSFTADGFALEAVPVAEAFVGKEGAYSHIIKRDIHPNQQGYAKIAEVFATAIWGEYMTPAAKTEPITVVVGGRTVATPHVPALIGGTTFVPLREYTEALGATVKWDDATATATVSYNGQTVALTIDSTTIRVNGTAKPVGAAPHIHASAGERKTYIPLRLMAEGLGFDVQFIQQTGTAYINR